MEKSAARKQQILFIDDRASTHIPELLKAFPSFDIVSFTNPTEAIEAFKFSSVLPEAILLDINFAELADELEGRLLLRFSYLVIRLRLPDFKVYREAYTREDGLALIRHHTPQWYAARRLPNTELPEEDMWLIRKIEGPAWFWSAKENCWKLGIGISG